MCAIGTGTRPLISVFLPTLNEGHGIRRCLDSLLRQDNRSCEIEVLAIDGGSTDNTRPILESYAARDARVRVFTNERRRTPFAYNLGLREARGEYVCIFGGHCMASPDYFSTCLDELIAHGAGSCGGRVVSIPANNTLQARLGSWAAGHRFGSSSKSFRTYGEGYVDTVNYGVMRRELPLAMGGYDEELLRNQDNDMNQKLLARGHTMYCTWKTQCCYWTRSTLAGLFGYMRANGFWNVISLKINPASMAARHFIPFLFVACLMGSALLAAGGLLLPSPVRWLLFAPLIAALGAHLIAGSLAAVEVARRERSLAPLLLPPVFLGIHLAYGFGTLSAFLKHPESVQYALGIRKSPPKPPAIPLAQRLETAAAGSGQDALQG
jgi:succinoglycan biosynthesis protein ExoA